MLESTSVSLFLIDFYRSHLSQSFLFKKQQCSFKEETCSGYGRKAFSTQTFTEAYRRTRRRMKRCHDYKLFAFDPEAIGWEQGFQRILDNPREDNLSKLVAELHRDEEQPAAIGHILNGAQAVHKYVHGRSSESIQQKIEQENVERYKAKVRSACGYQAYYQHRLANQALIPLALEATTLIEEVPDPLIHFMALGYSANCVRKYFKKIKLLDHFVRLGKIRKG